MSWAARYALTPVSSYDVRYRRARVDGKFGMWTTLRSATTDTSATFKTATGFTYCYAVRARDLDGVVSRWTNQAWDSSDSGCSTTPLDDKAFERSKGWNAGTGADFYKGTRLRSTKAGATLTMEVKAHWIALVARRARPAAPWRTAPTRSSQTISLTSPTRMNEADSSRFGAAGLGKVHAWLVPGPGVDERQARHHRRPPGVTQ